VSYELTDESKDDSIQVEIRRGIRGADPSDVGTRDWVPLTLTLRASDGTIAGGVYGATMWGWLMIDGLWVAEELRGQGLGRRLLLEAESIAVDRGCRGSWLGTFDFQAREFYERLGYVVFAELQDFPAGHRHYHLRKSFTRN